MEYAREGIVGRLAACCCAALTLAVLTASWAAEARGDPVVAAAGDIACAPSKPSTSTSCRQRATSDLLVTRAPTAVITLGDHQYDTGKLSSFLGSYDQSWGRVKSITHPAAGNHEYFTSGASGYFDYFNGAGRFSGPAGDRDKGYYSFDVGAWHLIALNSSDHCQMVACGKGSAQEQWLRADLAAHPNHCTLAYWHHPYFKSGHEGNATFMQAMFQDLYDAGADVVLGGHAHDYERFAPQDPTGRLDNVRGIRQFVVGTGGAFFTPFGAPKPNSQVRNDSTYGVLELALHPTSYDWTFVPEAGRSFSDSGSGSCHAKAPAPPPTGLKAPKILKAPGSVATGSHSSSNIYVVSLRNRRLTRLTRYQEAEGPSWSPNRRILFSAVDCEQCPSKLFLVDSRGLNQALVRTSVQPAYEPSWSPGGHRIAVVVKGKGIYSVNLRNGRVRRLTSDPSDESPAWSPTGHWIAFERRVGGSNYELFVVSAVTGRVRRLTDDRFQETNPAWSPNGSRVAFSQQLENGNWAIFTMRADGSRRRRITGPDMSAQEPAWSPNGHRIAFIQQGLDWSSLAIIDAGGRGKPVTVVPSSLSPSRPSWSRGSGRIAFSATAAS
jgi:Tol biopolymer transport system component